MIRAGASSLREMFALTRGLPDLRALIASGIAGTLAAGLLDPVLPLYLTSHGLDLPRIGLVFTLGSLVPLVLQPVLGALSDRWSRKGFLIAVSLSTSLLVPLLAFLNDPLPLAAALAAKLMLERSVTPLSGAMLGDLAPTAQRATVFGLLSSAVSLTFVAGLVLSSAATRLLRPPGVFALAGALFLGSALLLFTLSDDRARAVAPAAGESPLRAALLALASPVTYVRRDPALGFVFAYELAFVFALDLFPIYLPLFAVKLGAPAAAVGPLVASSWLVYGLIQPLGGRLSDRRAGRTRMISHGLLALSACSALLALSARVPAALALPLMIAAWVLMAIPDGLCRPSSGALLVDLAPEGERGRFFGAIGAVGTLGHIVAPLVYGLVAARAGLFGAFLLSSAALLVAFVMVRRIREPAAPTEPS